MPDFQRVAKPEQPKHTAEHGSVHAVSAAPARSAPPATPSCPDCGGPLVPYTGEGNPHKVGTGFCAACGGRKPLAGAR